MKLTKKLEAEVLEAYHSVWNASFKGDMKAFAAMLDENCHIIGSSAGELFSNKKSALKFYKATAEQIVGKVELRNRKIELMPVDKRVMVNEESDFYLLIDNQWTFYGHARISSLFHKKNNKWKVIHQHASFPDSKTDEGEQINAERIKAENLQLRDAVKRRTAELENKNRELEVEAALERVRSASLAMHHSDELEKVVEVLFHKLAELGMSFSGALIYVFDRKKRNALLWVASQVLPVPVSVNVPYDEEIANNPIVEDLWHAIENSGEIINRSYSGKTKNDYFRYVFKNNESLKLPDEIKSFQLEAESYTVSFTAGKNSVVGFDNWSEQMTSEKDFQILKRFARVFEQAYTRFIDLQKAEAQAREAQIEAALEKVRSRSLAMHSANELGEVVTEIVEKLKDLGVVLDANGVVLCTYFQHSKDVMHWIVSPDYSMAGSYLLPYFDHPIFNAAWQSKENGDEYFSRAFSVIEKNSFFEYAFEHSDYRHFPDDFKQWIFQNDQHILSFAWQKNSAILIPSHTGVLPSEQDIAILKRFAKVFEQSYVRFLDLQKAEVQARESQIQLALERVRARTMAMHQSGELADTASVLFQQIKELGFETWSCGFCTWTNNDLIEVWMAADSGGLLPPMTIPYKEEPTHSRIYEASLRGETAYDKVWEGKELERHYAFLKTIPSINEAIEILENSGLSLPSRQCYYVGFFKQGYLLLITKDPNAELKDLSRRFARVFEQTYTRFLDLQKAEAQAKESQIQLALERVRARTMAMQKSNELQQVVNSVYERLNELEVEIDGAAICTFIEGTKDYNVWIGDYQEPLRIKFNEFTQVQRDYNDAIERREELFTNTYSGEIKKEYIQFLLEQTVLGINIPEEQKRSLLASAFFTTSLACTKNTVFQLYRYTAKSFSKVENNILSRFAKVFEQSYVRFLDLQKAEAQAREAQIEAALERIRSRTMGMQRSEELAEVATLLFQQVKALGVQQWTCGFGIFEIDDKEFTWYQGADDGAILPPCIIPLTEHPVFIQFNEARKRGDELYIYEKTGEMQADHYRYMCTLPVLGKVMQDRLDAGMQFPAFQVDHVASFSHGNLVFITYEHFPEMHNVFKRFAKVFDLTYRRFLDLQKAEAQAREARIEAALERVRSRTMAMQNSNELADVALALFQQVKELGITAWAAGFNIWQENDASYIDWMTGPTGDFLEPYTVDLTTHPVFAETRKARQRGDEFFVSYLEGEQIVETYALLNSFANKGQLQKLLDLGIQFPTHQFNHYVFGAQVSLLFITYEPCPEAWDIFKRFGKVFEQTYTRFLDLQKAEAQAREAQIEAALERVRSRTMAMQRSEELAEVATVLFQQVKALGVSQWVCGFSIWEIGDNEFTWYPGSPDGEILEPCQVPLTEHPVFISYDESRLRGDELFVYEKEGEFQADHYRYMQTIPGMRKLLQNILDAGLQIPTFQIDHIANFSHGNLIFITYEHFPEMHDIFKRFAKVFDLTYTRFLDLQKAEAQTREARIEAALEKIRSTSLGMHRSDEIMDVVNILFEKLKELDLIFDGGAAIHVFTEGSRDAQICVMSPLGTDPILIDLPFDEIAFENNPIILDVWKAKDEGADIINKHYSFEQKNRYFEYVFKYNDEIKIPKPVRDFIFKSDSYMATFIAEKNSLLGASSWTGQLFSEADLAVLKRVARVFEQAYVRFLDLKKAESQAIEAVKRASVDRVRAEIASMRTTNDLERITPLVWNELTTLGVSFIRCGVFIMDEEKEEVQSFLSTPDGQAIAAFRQPYDAPGEISEMVTSWHKKEMYKQHWNEARFVEFTKGLMDQGAVTSGEKYLIENRPTDLYLHFIPFLQGMLYAGNTAPLSDDELQLVQNLADAFSTAYARYEDFNKLEHAKQQVDKALVDLKQAQQQLVQSEKMASLGELTAGIAHEIQNPLNFVNNFSEVNAELIHELYEELEKGNMEQVSAIAASLRENEEKIAHHGKRADAIVRGMLQHSRASAGQKEPTDINTLADEYLRLSYHGMRAKDKSFNAEIQIDFDDAIGKINIIRQDMGRVLLNLYNNAFYAVAQRKKTDTDGYKPLVSISTKKIGEEVEISVSDNGTGIPEKIKDKIFQPFFTTKPTGQGTGLGLSLSYDIVKAHGGALKVETKESEGTEFVVQLPV